MTIKNATPLDIEPLSLVFNQVITALPYYTDTAKEHELNKYTVSELFKKLENDPGSVIIAEDNSKIVGFCLNRLDDMLIWLEWFGVSEVTRGRGIGKNIIQYLESTAVTRGAHKIWCDCRTENRKSINLLSAVGYTPICTLKNHWYKQDFILWQKELY
jgi:ribosomal protein S18 acetylase RimI-like enzyme